MKLLLAACLTAASLAAAIPAATPASAASIYVGPGGVGVGPGWHPYRGRAFVGRRPLFEGRSAYHPYRRDFRRF